MVNLLLTYPVIRLINNSNRKYASATDLLYKMYFSFNTYYGLLDTTKTSLLQEQYLKNLPTYSICFKFVWKRKRKRSFVLRL